MQNAQNPTHEFPTSRITSRFSSSDAQLLAARSNSWQKPNSDNNKKASDPALNPDVDWTQVHQLCLPSSTTPKRVHDEEGLFARAVLCRSSGPKGERSCQQIPRRCRIQQKISRGHNSKKHHTPHYGSVPSNTMTWAPFSTQLADGVPQDGVITGTSQASAIDRARHWVATVIYIVGDHAAHVNPYMLAVVLGTVSAVKSTPSFVVANQFPPRIRR